MTRTTSLWTREVPEAIVGQETNPYQAPSGVADESPPNAYGPFQSLIPLTRSLIPWLWLSALGEVVGVVWEWVQLYGLLGDAVPSAFGIWAPFFPRLGPFFVCAILFARYLYRSNANCRALGVGSMSYSPAAMVWWHFVPFAHLFVPYLAVKEVVFASFPEGNVEEVLRRVLWWWSCWAGSSISVYLAVLVEPGSLPERMLGLLASATFVASSILAVGVVKSLAERQDSTARSQGLAS